MPSTKTIFKAHRSYKQRNEEKFLQDLEQANLTTLIENEDNVNEAYNTFHTKLMDIVDNHMPMKKRKTVPKPAPFMNQQLRNAIYKKQMLHNKYLHLRSKKNWKTYRNQRNFVNKLRRQSIRNYFVERCTGRPRQNYFWSIIKPFLTNKGSHFENNIILCNNDEIINNQSDVAEIFNNYFVNVQLKTLAVKVVLWMIIIQAFRPSEKIVILKVIYHLLKSVMILWRNKLIRLM